jgi:hypothetical protein
MLIDADALDNQDKLACEDAERRVYRLLEDGIGELGGLTVAAGVCGIDRGDLRRALDHKGRYVAVEHAMAIGGRLRRFNYGLATKLGSAIVECFDLDVFPRTALTDKERADRLEAMVRSMPLGDQLVANAYGGRVR